MVFLMGISPQQQAMAENRDLELILTPIGREAFIFFVNSRNSINNLSTEDIQRVYSGEVKNWREVGGENDSIRAFQRPEDSGSQTMLKEIMGNIPLAPAPSTHIQASMMNMYGSVASYQNYRNALGYSFLFYIRDMIDEDEVKYLTIDDVAPTPDNIANGVYPFAHEIYAITVRSDGAYLNPERTEHIDSLLAWMMSSQGQYLVEETGYVPMQFATK